MAREILLVEDDPAIADALRLHLEDAGFALAHAADGVAAERAIDRGGFDLLLLDLTLPGADGWDLCRRLRAHDATTPVIMVSARAAEAHRVLGLELGADDYLVKPFSMLELVARVRSQFRRAEHAQQPAAAALLRFGGFRLDLLARRLENEHGVVALTQREFELLAFLARHPRRDFGRGELLDRVWGPGFDGYEHTVNSHINRLRQKIEADPREPRHIVTVWGVGYRFEPGAA